MAKYDTLWRIIGALGIGSAFLYAATRNPAKEEEPPPSGGADIKIEVYDDKGNLVPAHSPITINEGVAYTVKVSITNSSKYMYTNSPAPVSMMITVSANYPSGAALIPLDSRTVAFTAGQTQERSYSFTVPVNSGFGGKSSTINVNVLTPDGSSVIASGNQQLDIITAVIIYGATITFA